MDRLRDKIIPVLTILAALVAVWYVAAVFMNAPFQRDLDRRAGETPGTIEFIGKTLSQPKPTMPAPHQVAQNFFENTFLRKVTSNRSLVYHSWVTLSSTDRATSSIATKNASWPSRRASRISPLVRQTLKMLTPSVTSLTSDRCCARSARRDR